MSDIRSWHSPGPVAVWMSLSVGGTPQPRTTDEWFKFYRRAAEVAFADATAWKFQAEELEDIPELSQDVKAVRVERLMKYAAAAEGAAHGYIFRAAELIYDK